MLFVCDPFSFDVTMCHDIMHFYWYDMPAFTTIFLV